MISAVVARFVPTTCYEMEMDAKPVPLLISECGSVSPWTSGTRGVTRVPFSQNDVVRSRSGMGMNISALSQRQLSRVPQCLPSLEENYAKKVSGLKHRLAG